MFCVITFSREKLLDIRAAVTHQHYQHYDQECDFPESAPLFVPPRAIELIPEAVPKHCRRKRGTPSGLLVRLRMRAHHFQVYYSLMFSLWIIKLPSSGRGFLSRETSWIVTYSVAWKHGSLGIYCLWPCSQLSSQFIAQTGINVSSGRRAGVYVS